LQDYESNTGVKLAEHPLAMQLLNYRFIEPITTLLRQQARDFSDFRGYERIMKLVESIVSNLSALSGIGALGGPIGQVLQMVLMGVSCLTDLFCRHSHPPMQYKLASPSYLLYVRILSSHLRIL